MSKLIRNCYTCEYKDNSFYGCSKAKECYNGKSAYKPNADILDQEKKEGA